MRVKGNGLEISLDREILGFCNICNTHDESTILTNKLVGLSDRRMPVARDPFGAYYLLKFGFKTNEKNILHGLGEVLEQKQKE